MDKKDIFIESSVNLQNLAHEICGTLSVEEIVEFISMIKSNYGDVELEEALFLSELDTMIGIISSSDEYSGTKWEMLLSMGGLLELTEGE